MKINWFSPTGIALFVFLAITGFYSSLEMKKYNSKIEVY